MIVITYRWNHKNTKTEAAKQLLGTENTVVVARGRGGEWGQAKWDRWAGARNFPSPHNQGAGINGRVRSRKEPDSGVYLQSSHHKKNTAITVEGDGRKPDRL